MPLCVHSLSLERPCRRVVISSQYPAPRTTVPGPIDRHSVGTLFVRWCLPAAVIEVEGLTKVYGGSHGVKALDNKGSR